MAPTKAIMARIKGGVDVWGSRGVRIFQYTGPTSYASGSANGDEVDAIGAGVANQTGLRTIIAIIPSITLSGTYLISPQPGAVALDGAPTKFFLRWTTYATGAEVSNATNLSAEVAMLMVIGD